MPIFSLLNDFFLYEKNAKSSFCLTKANYFHEKVHEIVDTSVFKVFKMLLGWCFGRLELNTHFFFLTHIIFSVIVSGFKQSLALILWM